MKKNMSTKTTHVLFDLDGVLINTIDIVIEKLTDYAKQFGKDLTEDIKKRVANITNSTVFFNEFLDSIDYSEDEADRHEVRTKLIQMLISQKFDLIPGVERLVKHLHRHNIPMAIATGNTNRWFGAVSRDNKLFFKQYFTHVVCGWDDPEVVNKKPAPDVYIVCANRFQPKPIDLQNILVIEDSLTGITGAIASGMKTLLINDMKLCDFEGMADKITLICDSIEDFKPETIGLPAFDQ